MRTILDRLKRERRWAIALFVAALVTIAAVQLLLAPRANAPETPPAPEISG